MALFSDAVLALVILIFAFACMLIMAQFRVRLWKTLVMGCVIVALLTRLPLAEWWGIPWRLLPRPEFYGMEMVLFGLLMLSGIQGATGQNQRLVEGLDHYLRWPRLRLIVFPALIGLLPMPGGALFSCPMLDAAAHDMDISPERKTLINYWFRHTWELAWPLYPGYMLVCSLLEIPLLSLIKFTCPLVIGSFLIGWFFYIRDIPIPESKQEKQHPTKPSLSRVLYEALPILITLGGAGLLGMVSGLLHLDLSSRLTFGVSLICAVLCALYQGRSTLNTPLRRIAFSKSTVNLLGLTFAVFVFKDVVEASGLVEAISQLGGGKLVIVPLFMVLPLLCGMMTGVMIGYVGASFPLLLGMLAGMGMQEYLMPLVVIALVCGNIGQLITPVHICMVVCCDYYQVHYADIWRKLMPSLFLQLGYGIVWSLALLALGAHL